MCDESRTQLCEMRNCVELRNTYERNCLINIYSESIDIHYIFEKIGQLPEQIEQLRPCKENGYFVRNWA